MPCILLFTMYCTINKSYFLVEPPPRVSAPVRRILENSKVRIVDGKRIRAKYNARKVAQLRKKYIAAGYYWPEKPMRNRNLDRTPAGGIREKRKAERYEFICMFRARNIDC